ncbi:MAG: FHA domain-containing protein [Labilithrix sp.]|nr:FHA domain-containing protein [Labilithrix sp.]MCW5815803.1 FHA domain-containing protein [Labilithrix sp.]
MTDWTSEGTVRIVRRIRPATANPPAFELRVVEGPDAGAVHAIDPARGTFFVGSSPLCALRLSDEAAAPRHCSIELREGRLCLVDLSPERTTRVNGVLAHEAYLSGGEVVRFGTTAIAVRRADGTSLERSELRSFGRVRGESPEMLAIFPLFPILAERRGLLVIEGERGAGKRLLAEELHAHGPAKDGPFVVASRHDTVPLTARLLAAHGGTLYVEEGALLDRAALHVLANAAGARVIVATRGSEDGGKTLPAELGERVVLPPLREREGDVAALARMFWTDLGGAGALPDDFVARWEEHRWPGNVRELRIAVYDRVRHGNEPLASDVHEIVTSGHRPSVDVDALSRVLECELPFTRAREEVIAEFERRYVDRALRRANHNVARAAANSGIAHRYFQVLKSRRKSA